MGDEWLDVATTRVQAQNRIEAGKSRTLDNLRIKFGSRLAVKALIRRVEASGVLEQIPVTYSDAQAAEMIMAKMKHLSSRESQYVFDMLVERRSRITGENSIISLNGNEQNADDLEG